MYSYNINNDVGSQFEFLCRSGTREAFASFELKNPNFEDFLDMEQVIYGGILAIHYNNEVMLSLILQKFEISKDDMRTLLVSAADNHRIGCVKCLLREGADPAELQGGSAYAAFPDIKILFDEHLKNRQNVDVSSRAEMEQRTSQMMATRQQQDAETQRKFRPNDLS